MDVTWSVRMPEEMKDKVSSLVQESGMNTKDFMARIIQAYELGAAKETLPEIGADIDELDRMTSRIHAVFVNMCERTMYLQMQKDEESGARLREKQEAIEGCLERIKGYEDGLENCRLQIEGLESKLADAGTRLTDLNDLCAAKDALLQEYKRKNEDLTALLEEHKECKRKISCMDAELQTERDACRTAGAKLAETENEMARLRSGMDLAEKASEADFKMQFELKEIQNEKETLRIRQEFQQILAALQKEYSEKTKELLNVIEKLQTSRY